jgi:hypothetical protein
VLERRREAGHDQVEQLDGADAGGGVDRHHRVERAARDRPFQVLDEQLRVDVLAADVALHQRLVLGLLDDALDERTRSSACPWSPVIRPTSWPPSRRYTGSTLSPKASCAWATTPS